MTFPLQFWPYMGGYYLAATYTIVGMMENMTPSTELLPSHHLPEDFDYSIMLKRPMKRFTRITDNVINYQHTQICN